MAELILGGARSGKSALAEARAGASGWPVCYIATGHAGDAEMAARIAHHRARRPVHWRTVEAPRQLIATLQREAGAQRCLIVDCLTLWLSNLLLADAEADLATLVDEFAAALPALPGRILLVSNEVGCGIVPVNALARRFADEQGRLNQRVAAACQRVTLVAAGLPLELKGGS